LLPALPCQTQGALATSTKSRPRAATELPTDRTSPTKRTRRHLRLAPRLNLLPHGRNRTQQKNRSHDRPSRTHVPMLPFF
jgi:hypothetical protein